MENAIYRYSLSPNVWKTPLVNIGERGPIHALKNSITLSRYTADVRGHYTRLYAIFSTAIHVRARVDYYFTLFKTILIIIIGYRIRPLAATLYYCGLDDKRIKNT